MNKITSLRVTRLSPSLTSRSFQRCFSKPALTPSRVQLRIQRRTTQPIFAQTQCRFYTEGQNSWRARFQRARRDSPVGFYTSLSFVAVSIGLLYLTFVWYPRNLARSYAGFPDDVAVQLRKALIYSSDRYRDPVKALTHYKNAIELAKHHNMDPYSDQYFGMRVAVVRFLEKLNKMPKAIKLAEDERSQSRNAFETLPDEPALEARRTQILQKAVIASYNLAQLYTRSEGNKDEAVEETLDWAITAILKEEKRRMAGGLTSDGEDWLDFGVIGMLFELMGNIYVHSGRSYLAVPLLLQAITYMPPNSCHAAVVLNNISHAIFMQNPPSEPNAPAPLMANQTSSAREWAYKAVEKASAIKAPQRTNECDEACATALINLGNMALADGDSAEARAKFEEGKTLSKKVGYKEGVVMADVSLGKIRVSAEDIVNT